LLSDDSVSWLSIYCREVLEFVSHNDDIAQEIAERGHDMVLSHLRMEDVSCYWKKLLKRYAKLLQFKPEQDKSLIERNSS
jgi:protein glucosyltransferase